MNLTKLFLFCLLVSLFSCNKVSIQPLNIPEVESPIAFIVSEDPGLGSVLAVLGTSQQLNIKLTSKIPVSGVLVGVSVTKDVDNTTVFTNSNSSITSINNVTITGLTPGVLCTATVVVTSKSTTTNTKTLTFKLVAK